MSTSTLSALITTSVQGAWDYITVTLSPLFLFAVGIAVTFGVLYFILRRMRILK